MGEGPRQDKSEDSKVSSTSSNPNKKKKQQPSRLNNAEAWK